MRIYGGSSGISGLSGDVTASGTGVVAATVAFVGGSPASEIATAENLANAATNTNTASAIVKRDSNGDFAARYITATEFLSNNSGSTIAFQVANVSNTRAAYGVTGGTTKGVGFNTDGNTWLRGGGAAYYEVSGTVHAFVAGMLTWLGGDGNYHHSGAWHRAPNTTQTGNTAATLTDLFSLAIAGGTVSVNGISYEFEYHGTFAATASTDKKVKVVFGSTTILDTGSLAVTTAKAWTVRGRIIRTGSATGKAFVSFICEDTTNAPPKETFTSLTETWSSSLNIKCQGQGTNASDVVGECANVWINQKFV